MSWGNRKKKVECLESWVAVAEYVMRWQGKVTFSNFQGTSLITN